MRRMTRLVALAMILTGLPVVPALAAPEPGGGRTEVLTRVIVTLDEDVLRPEVAAMRAAEAVGGRVEHVYRHALKGFSMELREAALSALERRPGVARVERDVEVRIAAQPVPTGVDRIDGDVNPGAGNFSDVDVAVLDTGVWFDTTPSGAVSHEDLNLIRVSDCTGAIFYPLFGGCQGGGNDGNGHGTHVASRSVPRCSTPDGHSPTSSAMRSRAARYAAAANCASGSRSIASWGIAARIAPAPR